MTWYEQLLYDLLPEGFYIRCSRVVIDDPWVRGQPAIRKGYNVLLMKLRRDSNKKALVLEDDDVIGNYPHRTRDLAEWEAERLEDERFAFYLGSRKLYERAAIRLLNSPYLLDYIVAEGDDVVTWYQQILYDLLPDGTYIRCCRVVEKNDVGFSVSILHLRRSKYKRALVLEHAGYRYGPHPIRAVVEDYAKDLSHSYAFYLRSGKLDEESAVKLLRSAYLLDYIGFDRGMARPGESVEDTIDRLIPKETLNNIRVMTDMMS